MKRRFQNKYRYDSTRMPHWNYGWRAAYLITLCTQNRERYFGSVVKGKMQLSEIGEIARTEWLKTPEIRPDMNITLDEFIVMPDHIHGIIIIGRNKYNTDDDFPRWPAMHGGPTKKPKYKNKFGPQRKNLSSVIRGFKSAVTVKARQIQPEFEWQPLFYDHIIRNKGSFFAFRNYIRNNPSKLRDD